MGAGVVIALRAGLVLLLGMVVQASFVTEIRLFDAHGEVLMLVPIVAGITGGAERGAVAGFAAGIAVDLLVQTPFGLTALTYCLLGYGVGALQTGVLRASWWLPMLSAMAGSAIGIVLFAVAVTVVGEVNAVNEELSDVVLAVVIWNSLLVLPAIRVGRWVEAAGARSMMGVR